MGKSLNLPSSGEFNKLKIISDELTGSIVNNYSDLVSQSVCNFISISLSERLSTFLGQGFIRQLTYKDFVKNMDKNIKGIVDYGFFTKEEIPFVISEILEFLNPNIKKKTRS